MDILVCIGSACHVRGSYKIMNDFKKLVLTNGLEGVVVKGAFCLGACNSGVTVKIDDELITGVTSENVKEIFEKHVLKRQC